MSRLDSAIFTTKRVDRVGHLKKVRLPSAIARARHFCPLNCYQDASLMLTPQKIKFPLWQYLTQPVFQAAYPLVLDPRRFLNHYQVELLERCLARSIESRESRDS
ncbi:MAG: hypothetical protein HC780_26460 [Leptolyngbyaceae cyanobacterium CSU_1_3]|nr:hypothetical protein [Leptolyngbyaceae cyanobacterium CSU_1_3]